VELSTLHLAEPNSITPSPVSAMELKTNKNTTSLETLGVQLGENKVTSESPPKKLGQVSAVFNKFLSVQLLESHTLDHNELNQEAFAS